MANIKSDGFIFDANLIIQTGVTITAGSLIFCDVSGTNVVRAVRSYSGTTVETSITLNHLSGTGRGYGSVDTNLAANGVFLGVLARTQTGLDGSQTGVSFYDQGVFQFNTTPTCSSLILVGRPCFAMNHDTVRCGSTGMDAGANLTSTTTSGSNTTGLTPIGIISNIIGPSMSTTTSTAATLRVDVKIYPHRTLQSYT